MDLLALIQKEWAVISQAPFTFVALTLLMFGVAYMIFRTRLIGAKELLSIRDKRISDYKEATGTPSPDDAAAKISELERKVANLDKPLDPKEVSDALNKLPNLGSLKLGK